MTVYHKLPSFVPSYSALISAFEKAKKKYRDRVKKLEQQLATVTERYEAQVSVETIYFPERERECVCVCVCVCTLLPSCL